MDNSLTSRRRDWVRLLAEWPGLAETETTHLAVAGTWGCRLEIADAEAVTKGLVGAGLDVPPDLARSVVRRQAEFTAGRLAAAVLLQRRGVATPGFLPRGPFGAPEWPPAVVGSISHAGGVAAAVVASAETYKGVGFDLEPWIQASTAAEVAPVVAVARELEIAASALGSEVEMTVPLTLVYSAKEALFKCLHPICREFFDFDDARVIEVSRSPNDAGTVRLELGRDLGDSLRGGDHFEGHFRLPAGWVEVTVAAPR